MMEASVVPFEYAGWPSRGKDRETLLRIINDTPRMPAEVRDVPGGRRAGWVTLGEERPEA